MENIKKYENPCHAAPFLCFHAFFTLTVTVSYTILRPLHPVSDRDPGAGIGILSRSRPWLGSPISPGFAHRTECYTNSKGKIGFWKKFITKVFLHQLPLMGL